MGCKRALGVAEREIAEMPAAQGEIANREVRFTLLLRTTITIVTSLAPRAGSSTAKEPLGAPAACSGRSGAPRRLEPSSTYRIIDCRLGRGPKRRRAIGNTAGQSALARFVHIIIGPGAAADRVV